MNSPEIKTMTLSRLTMAHDTLDDMHRLVASGANGRSIVNRAYYAMFYAILALANHRQMPVRKHQATIAFFDREFVRTGIFSKEMSVALHESFDLRMEADYADFCQPAPEEISASVNQAKVFVDRINTYLQQQMALS